MRKSGEADTHCELTGTEAGVFVTQLIARKEMAKNFKWTTPGFSKPN